MRACCSFSELQAARLRLRLVLPDATLEYGSEVWSLRLAALAVQRALWAAAHSPPLSCCASSSCAGCSSQTRHSRGRPRGRDAAVHSLAAPACVNPEPHCQSPAWSGRPLLAASSSRRTAAAPAAAHGRPGQRSLQKRRTLSASSLMLPHCSNSVWDLLQPHGIRLPPCACVRRRLSARHAVWPVLQHPLRAELFAQR